MTLHAGPVGPSSPAALEPHVILESPLHPPPRRSPARVFSRSLALRLSGRRHLLGNAFTLEALRQQQGPGPRRPPPVPPRPAGLLCPHARVPCAVTAVPAFGPSARSTFPATGHRRRRPVRPRDAPAAAAVNTTSRTRRGPSSPRATSPAASAAPSSFHNGAYIKENALCCLPRSVSPWRLGVAQRVRH